MKIRHARLCMFAAAALCLVSNLLDAQVNVTTYHNDVARTGQNTQETILTPSNVNATTFGKLFSVALDGYVYAQPLYLSNVTINGGTHNVVYVATEHDSLYAIDANNGTVYWQRSLIPAGGSTVNSSTVLDCGDLVPEVGITGTPVIDPSSGTIYLVAKSKVGGNVVQYLHAIDVGTAAEKFGSPVAIQASATGNASDAVGGLLTFNPQQENQRAALLLDKDSQGASHVVIGWSAHCDIAPWHGWIMSYSASTLAQEAVFNTSPNGYANGVWQSGSGPAADSSGNIYFATGNGSWNGTTDLGDSIVKVGPPSGGTFPVLDYFTPFDQANLSSNDLDVSSGGLILLPPSTNGQQQIVLQAKIGTIFNLNSSNLGKYCVNQNPACTNSDPQITQEIVNASVGVWGAPAYWNGSVYWAGGNDNDGAKDSIKAFSVNPATGLLSTTPTSQTTQTFGFSSPVPVVSSNGKTNGILWGLDDSQLATCTVKTYCQVLYAYDATNLANLLYSSQQAANFRDVPAGGVKFATPTVANGKVYVGSQYLLAAYGLLAETPTATPVLSPAGGTFTSAQSVTITDATAGSTIYYTTDGTTPTTASTLYTGPIPLSATTTINAIATASGFTTSGTATGTYTVTLTAPPSANPVFSPAAGSFASAQSVTITDATPGSTIYYTTNGIVPTTASTLYTGPIAVGATTTISALAVATGYTNSAVATAKYTIGTVTPPATPPLDVTLPSPTIYAIGNPGVPVPGTGLDGGGHAYDASLLGSTLTWSGVNFVLGTPDVADAITSTTIPIAANTYSTLYLLGAAVNGGQVAQSFVVTYTDGTSTTFTQSVSDWFSPQSFPGESVALAMADRVQPDGTLDTRPFYLYGYSFALNPAKTVLSFTLPANNNIAVLAIALQPSSPTTATPVFGPAAGTFTSAQSVTITDATAGSKIYYTTNGATPTTASTLYTGPIAVSATTTINAFAVASGYTNSSVATATYTIGTVTTPPTPPVDITLPSPTIYAIGNPGVPVPGTGLDGGGHAYDASLLGSTLTWSGVNFALGMPDVADAITSTTIPIEANTYSTLYLLGAAVNGGQAAQSFVVTYSDGTTTTFPQGVSDWFTPQSFPGESVALAMADRVQPDGTLDLRPFYLYGYSFALNPAKTVLSLTLPANNNVAVLAIALQPTAPATAPPVFSPAAGSFTSAQSVTITDATAGSKIYYTTNGSTPTTASTLYTGAIPVSATTTINAFATSAAATNSSVATATYTISAPPPSTVPTPTLSPTAGSFTSAQSVTISDTLSATATVKIYYTTNGSTPTTASTLYTGPIAVNATTTINAFAVASGYTNSSVATATYTINLPPSVTATPVLSPAAGSFSSVQSVTITDATAGSTIYYTTNGATPTTASTVYTGPIAVSATTTINAFAVASGYTNSSVATATYTIGTVTTPPTSPVDITLPSPTVYAIANRGKAVPGGGIDAGGHAYDASLLGSTLTWSGVNFALGTPEVADAITSSTVQIPANTYSTLYLLGTAVNGNQAAQSFVVTYTDGTTTTFPQSVSNWNTPQSFPGESVALAMADRLQPDGTLDTRTFNLYGYSFALNPAKTVLSLTLPANNNVVVLAIALQPTAPATATPVFSPAAGSFTSAQSVTITDATAGSKIYYTTNGATPTTASTLYTGAIPVSATTTINAFATSAAATNSSVATATYTISAPPPSTVPTPTLSPTAGSFTSAQSVTISDTLSATATVKIYYTTNGSTPTTASTLYTGPIAVNATTTINAFAVASGYTNSSVATATYTINLPPSVTATPVLSPAAGSFSSAQSVTITDATAGSTIYYTTNGSTPTTASTVYTGPIAVSATTTINAFAVASGYTNSSVATATYTIGSVTTPPTPPVDITLPSPTVYAIANRGKAVPGGGIDYSSYAYDSTLLGSTLTWSGVNFALGAPEVADAITSTTVQIPANTYSTLYLLGAGAYGNQTAQSFVVTYTDGTTKTFTQSISDWGTPQSFPGESVALAMADRVQPDGTLDTRTFNLYGYSFALNPAKTVLSLTLPANNNVFVLAIALQPAASATATPVFSPAAGSFTSAQSVTITDATAGSKIYYTTNGSTPTTASTLYTGAIPVSATTTINAFATSAAATNSSVATATYTISAPPPSTVPTPTFSPTAGSFTSAQSVTISDTLSATATVKIYYTTNGSTPTTASTLYTGPIAVNATTTINAFAVASGYTNSSVATATYTINVPLPVAATPVLSPAAGSFSSAQSVTITDATAGSTIYYTTNGSTPTTASTVYTGPIAVSATTTINAFAVATGYTNSSVATATYTISVSTPPVDITLPSPTVYAIANRGKTVPGGGVDGSSYAYDATLLGSTLTWSGVNFALGTPEVADAITSSTVQIPANTYSTLYLLGTAVWGNQAAQPFVVTYTDGTTTTFTQSMSDWGATETFAGESVALAMADRVQPNGTLDTRTFNLYGYSFAPNPAKKVLSLTLPANNEVLVLAIALK